MSTTKAVLSMQVSSVLCIHEKMCRSYIMSMHLASNLQDANNWGALKSSMLSKLIITKVKNIWLFCKLWNVRFLRQMFCSFSNLRIWHPYSQWKLSCCWFHNIISCWKQVSRLFIDSSTTKFLHFIIIKSNILMKEVYTKLS